MRDSLKKWGFLCAWLLCACEETSLPDLDLERFPYRGRTLSHVELYDSTSVLSHVPAAWNLQKYAISGMANLDYAVTPGDTLRVKILEFSSDMAALAFYLNTGLVQENLPVTEGNVRELVLRAGKRLFIFRYGILRNHGRGELEGFVREFPDSRSGLPPEFLSLPMSGRIPGETSIQMRDFLGIPSAFPMLIQGFRENDVSWMASRSWEAVPEAEWERWTAGLQKRSATSWSGDTLLFDLLPFERGMAMRLQGGRIVCVWGGLSPETLKKHFRKVAKGVYHSPE